MSKNGNKTVEVTAHPFGPGDKVAVHKANDVEQERRSNSEPNGKPVATATVDSKGALKVSVSENGQYVAVAEKPLREPGFNVSGPGFNPDPGPDSQFEYVSFGVK